MPSELLRGVAFHFIGRGSSAHPLTIRAEGQSSRTNDRRTRTRTFWGLDKASRMASSYSRLLSVARRGCKLGQFPSRCTFLNFCVSLHHRYSMFAPCQMAVRPLSSLWSSFRQQMAEEEAHAARTMVNWRRVVCNM